MKNAVSLLVFLVCVSIPARAQQPKSLFYMTHDPNSVRSFLAHADKIDTLVPAWYVVDGTGLVSGGPNPLVMETARQAHVPVMPIVANEGFVQEDFHKLLGNPAGYRQMFAQLVNACKNFGYAGIQFDFENVNWTDRDAFSAMIAEAASVFHAQNLKLTIATVPNAPGAAGETGYSAWILRELARSLRSRSTGEVRRSHLPDDLRSAYAVDAAGAGGRLAVDREQSRIRAPICAA